MKNIFKSPHAIEELVADLHNYIVSVEHARKPRVTTLDEIDMLKRARKTLKLYVRDLHTTQKPHVPRAKTQKQMENERWNDLMKRMFPDQHKEK